MANKVSKEEIALFKSFYRQTAKIQVLGVDGLDELTEADILQGGMTVDRYCFSSNALEIGTAIASELSLELQNIDGRFDAYRFDGARLIVRIGIKKWDARDWEKAQVHYIPLGIFTVDEKTKNKSSITLGALDNMVRFDREYDTNLVYPATLGEIVEDACSKCGVFLHTTEFYNADYIVETRPEEEGLTYRQVIGWAAQLACANAFIDWDGKLRLSWFEDTEHIIPPDDRYDSDVEENSVLITGVKVVTLDDNEYTAGTSGAVMTIQGNRLAQSNPEYIAGILYAKLGNFTYLPYSCVCRPMPYLYPMDLITLVDKNGKEHKTIVSSVTYTLNGTTDVAGEGDGETKGGYAATGTMTEHEKAIIEKAKKTLDRISTERYNVALSLNQMIGSAFGLYRTEVKENNVSTWYYHDKETLGDSTIIYVFNAGGFAWTDDWNGGNPIWQYGFTKDGNAIYKVLSAYKIQADYIDTGAITADKIASGTITADKIRIGAIGGFVIDESHIGVGKTAYDDTQHDGVYISPQGIGLGKGKFYVTDSGFFHAESGEIGDCSIVDGVLKIPAANITGTLTARQIDASTLTVSAANITGSLSIGQLPQGMAKTSDIPTRTSALLNDSGYQTTSGVVSIIDGRITADYIDAIGITAKNLLQTSTDALRSVSIQDGWANFQQSWGTYSTKQVVSSLYNQFTSTRNDSGKKFFVGLGTAPNAAYVGWENGASIQFSKDNGSLFGTWLESSSGATISDRNKKHDIEALPERYNTLFDNLSPSIFKYDDGTSGRTHVGFIAQDVENAILDSSLTTQDFAGFIRAEHLNSQNQTETSCFLRYEEFIALNTWQIQNLKKRVAELEAKMQYITKESLHDGNTESDTTDPSAEP